MARICAIVVTFQPAPELAGNIAALTEQVDQVLIVDNGSRPAGVARVRQVSASRVEALFNQANRGIAAALNQGIAWARERDFEWVALFDQDSRVPVGYFDDLLGAHADYPAADKVAIVCPRLLDRAFGREHSFLHGNGRAPGRFAEVPVAITSGCLIPLRLAPPGGWFREDLFIDYVDAEFALRCRRAGRIVLEVQDVVLSHLIGSPTRHRFFWMNPIVTNHSAPRLYFGMRNRVVVYREYVFFDPRWVFFDARETLRALLKIALFERQRRPKFRAIAWGFRDGLFGRLGPLREQCVPRSSQP